MGLRKYMIFRLGAQKYCLPLSQVREVIGLPKVTEVPGVGGFQLGLINLRGQIIGILDLANKIAIQNKDKGNPEKAKAKMTVVIVEGPRGQIGCKVDDVVEVFAIDESQIESTSESASSQLSGMVKTKTDEVQNLFFFWTDSVGQRRWLRLSRKSL